MSDAAEGMALRQSYFIPVKDMRWLSWNGLVLAIYWTVLAFSYVHSVSPINGTDTFLYLRINQVKIIEGMLWATLLLPTINTDWTRPSDFGLTMAFYFGLVPTLLLFGLADQPRNYMYPMIGGYIAVYAACRTPIQIPRFRLRQAGRSGVYIAAASVVIVLLWFAAKGNRSNFNMDLNAVYDYRDEASSLFKFGPLIYLASWVPEVLNPFLFCYLLYKRRWVLFVLSFAFEFFCLVIYQQKDVFVPCVMLPLFYFAPTGRHARVWLVLSMTATVVVAEVIFMIYDFPFFMEVWTRRFFFVQQFLYFSYFDVFGKIGFVYYSDSFLRSFIHYPFQYPPAPLVAYYAWGTTVGSPNTGFLGAGYMEFGVPGVIINGLVAGLTLKLFDRVVPSRMPAWFFATVAFNPFTNMLIAQNFQTSLLSAGVAPMFLLMLLAQQLDGPEVMPHSTRRPLPSTA